MGSNRQIAKNTAFLYVRMFIVLAVSLYTSRRVLQALDVVDFGIYNVVAGFVSLFGFLETTLSSSIQRFYNFEETRQGPDGFRKVFSEGIVIQTGLSLSLLILLETVGLWYVNHVMVIPPERLRAANFLFQFSTLSLMLVLFQVPFSGAIIARERMDFFALVSIIEVFLKLGIALLLTRSGSDRLILYGGLMLAVTAVSTVLMAVYSHLRFPELRFLRQRDPAMRKSLLSFSGWSLVGAFVFMMKGQGLNMLLNFFFGPVINAARGLTYQISGAIGGFSSNITVAFRPQVVSSFAEGDRQRTRDLMFMESRICFGLIALLITPVIIEMDYILHLWLGPVVPEHTAAFATLVLTDTLVCTLNTPCTQVVYAVGDIRRYQIWTTIWNLLLLPVCWLLLKGGLPPESVFAATLVFSVVLQPLCLFLTRQVFPFSWTDYGKRTLLPCLGTAVLLPILPGLIRFLAAPSFWRLLGVCFATVAAALPVCYFLILDAHARGEVRKALRRFGKGSDTQTP
ncbi:MAG: hypothetical protein IJ654_01980 [Bacteroidales bacterium]|nr:hypothetical protein [Bacteroidales bacterium]